MKTLCALIGAFFVFAGLAILVADLARGAPRAGTGSSASASPSSPAAGPLLREADAVPSGAGARTAAEAVSRRR